MYVLMERMISKQNKNSRVMFDQSKLVFLYSVLLDIFLFINLSSLP